MTDERESGTGSDRSDAPSNGPEPGASPDDSRDAESVPTATGSEERSTSSDERSTSSEPTDRESGSGAAASGAPADERTTGDSLSTEDGIDPEEIDPSELTLAERSLHPRIRVLWIVRAVITALVVGGIVAAIDVYQLEIGPVLPVGVAAVVLVLGVSHAVLRYRVWRYEVREDALYLERGVVTRVRTVVPFVRIQHVDTRRGPVERATGLATSVVYTAGSRGADVAIPGLDAEHAEEVQGRLKRLAIAAEDDTAV